MKKQLLNINVPKVPKPTFDDFKGFNEKFSIIYDFITRVIIIGVLLTFLLFFLKEMTSNRYVLTSIEVAKEIEENDKIYQSDLKQKIIIDMKSMMGNAKNATHSISSIANSVSNDAIPLNIAGFDLNQMFLYLRSFFQMQNREIRAYLMREGIDSQKYKVLLSVGNEAQTETIISGEGAVNLFLAEKILKYNAPHKVGLYLIDKLKNDVSKQKEIDEVIKYLGTLEEDESWWEKVFQNNNWAEKKFHLEAMKHYNIKDYYSAKLYYDSIPNLKKYPEILLEIAQTNNQLNKDYNDNISILKKVNGGIKNAIFESDIYDINRAIISINENVIQFNEKEIKRNIVQTIDLCENVKNKKDSYFLEANEDKILKIKSIKRSSLIILAEAYSTNNYFQKSDENLEEALNELQKDDNLTKADIYNWAANIKLTQFKMDSCSSFSIERIQKAEDYIKQAIAFKVFDGNHFDTYAEILLAKRDIPGFYTYLSRALEYPNLSKKITSKDYKKDLRWSSFWDNPRFVDVLKTIPVKSKKSS
jgi:hypothetical protein